MCDFHTFMDFRIFQNPKNGKSAKYVQNPQKMTILCIESAIFVDFPANTSEEAFLVLGLF